MSAEDGLKLIIIFAIALAVLIVFFKIYNNANEKSKMYEDDSALRTACLYVGIDIETSKQEYVNELKINRAREIEKTFRELKCQKISDDLAKKINECVNSGKNCNSCSDAGNMLCLSLPQIENIIDACQTISSLIPSCLENEGKAGLMKCIIDHKEEWCK